VLAGQGERLERGRRLRGPEHGSGILLAPIPETLECGKKRCLCFIFFNFFVRKSIFGPELFVRFKQAEQARR
jgi:hypothetical protein